MSSVGNKYISNKEAVPLVFGDVFSGHEDKQFAIGAFNSQDVLSYKPDTIEQAYLRLRANVYIDQTRMLEENLRRSDGTELDENDERSTHFVVLENIMGRIAVFACMRLIEKTTDHNFALPIEEFFPDAFATPAPIGSIEVSRFIVRHDDIRNARAAKKELLTTGLSYILANNFGPVYGVVEPEFERDLKLMRLPIQRIAEPKLVSEYNDSNLGFEVSRDKLNQRIGGMTANDVPMPIGSFGYWGNIKNNCDIKQE